MPASGDPIAASDISGITAYTTAKPLVRITANATQSIANNSQTALQFASEDIDTHGFHDNVTNNSRITPSVAGYYRFKATYFTGGRVDYTTIDVCIAKNGTSFAPAERKSFSTAATQVSNALSVQAEAILSANGSTDYFEALAFQQNAAAVAQLTNQSQRFTCIFEAEFIRP